MTPPIPIDLSHHLTTEPYEPADIRAVVVAEGQISPHAVLWMLDEIEMKRREIGALVSECQDLRDENTAQTAMVGALRARVKRYEQRATNTEEAA